MTQDDKRPREEKREWVKPEARKMRAGSAKNTTNFDPDGGVGS